MSDRQDKRKKSKELAVEEVYGWNSGNNGGEMERDQPAAQNG